MSTHDDAHVEFGTADGVRIVGDIIVPSQPRAAAIVCHPHPQFGGNRFNPVVDAVYRALPTVDVASLRFDFRPAFDDGVGEQLDAEAALDELARVVPDVPRLACGYSFGAMIALSLDDPDLAAKILIAPPLGHLAADPGIAVPTLVLTPSDDQFAPPDVARPIVESWADADFGVIEMSDHFIVGRTGYVADEVTAWVSDRLPPRSPL